MARQDCKSGRGPLAATSTSLAEWSRSGEAELDSRYLSELLRDHLAEPFPKPDPERTYGDLFAELAELDGYYVGFAQRLVDKAHFSDQIRWDDARELMQRLRDQRAALEAWKYAPLETYVESLVRLVDAMREFDCGPPRTR
jgi:hypothetical protein